MADTIDYSAAPTVIMPRNPINLNPWESYLHTKVRQLQTVNIPPVFLASTPVNVVRRNLSATVTQVSIQMIRNPNQSFNSVTAQVQTPNGSLGAAVSSASSGPLTVNVTRSPVPSALQIQGANATGQRTPANFGSSVSRALSLV
jgi:hypothetical protein